MRNRHLLLGIFAAALLLFALPAHAAKPLLFGAVGGNGAWLTGPDAAWPADLEAQGTLWTSISPHIDLGGSGVYGFSHAYIRGEGWARLTATDAEDEDFNLYLQLGYRGGSIDALQPAEWDYGAGLGYRPLPEQFPRLLLIANAQLGATSNHVIATLGARYWFPISF